MSRCLNFISDLFIPFWGCLRIGLGVPEVDLSMDYHWCWEQEPRTSQMLSKCHPDPLGSSTFSLWLIKMPPRQRVVCWSHTIRKWEGHGQFSLPSTHSQQVTFCPSLTVGSKWDVYGQQETVHAKVTRRMLGALENATCSHIQSIWPHWRGNNVDRVWAWVALWMGSTGGQWEWATL